MAESIVKLIVDATQGIRSLGRFKKATGEAAKKVDLLKKAVKLQKAATEAAATKLSQFGNIAKDAFGKAQKAAQKYQSALGGIKGAIVSLGVAALTKRMIGQAANFAQTQIRLKALSAEYGEFGKIQQLVKNNAETFNLSQAESASQFSDIYARLRPLGKTLEEVQTVYKGFNATAIASGTSAAAASGAFLQLSQALGSGRLQGDEFRSVSEQIPGILGLVADEMGVTVGELKKLGSEGAITSDILINALAKGFEKNKDKIQQILAESPAAKFKEFSNATSELSNAIGTELLPVVTPAVELLTRLLKAAGKLPGPIKKISAAVIGLTAALVALAPLLGPVAKGFAAIKAVLAGITGAGLLAAGPWFALAAGIGAAAFALNNYQFEAKNAGTAENLKKRGAELLKINDSIAKAEARRDAQTDKRARESAQLTVDNFEDIRQRKLEEIRKIREALPFRERNTLVEPKQVLKVDIKDPKSKKGPAGPDPAEKIAQQLKSSEELKIGLDGQFLVLTQIDEREKIRVATMFELSAINRKYNDLIAAALSNEEKQNLEVARGLELGKARIEQGKALEVVQQAAVTSQADFLKSQFAAAAEIDAQIEAQGEKMKALYASIGQTISTGIVDSLTAAVDGTKSLAEVASNTLNNIANTLLKFGVNSLLGGLGSGGGFLGKLFDGFRADGGTVAGGKSYIVGERGPEIFSPGRSGSIAPNGALGGGANVVVNVDASGSSAQGDGRQAKQLGSAIGAAVQAELIKQKRPGGLLSA